MKEQGFPCLEYGLMFKKMTCIGLSWSSLLLLKTVIPIWTIPPPPPNIASVAFSLHERILKECLTIHSPPALFFLVEIRSRTLIPLFRPGSVHSSSASWATESEVYKKHLPKIIKSAAVKRPTVLSKWQENVLRVNKACFKTVRQTSGCKSTFFYCLTVLMTLCSASYYTHPFAQTLFEHSYTVTSFLKKRSTVCYSSLLCIL